MLFKVLDKFFDEIKNVFSFIIFIFIAIAVILFLYWIAFAAKLNLPEGINSFAWGVIKIFSPIYSTFKTQNDITPILPLIASAFIGVIVYGLNCILVLLESLHKKCQNTRDMCRIQLEKTINTQLHNSFLQDLKTKSIMLIKLRVLIEKKDSYLSKGFESVDVNELSKEIENNILNSIDISYAKAKGRDGNSAYILVSNLQNTKELLTELVSNSSKQIRMKMNNNLKIDFYCAVDVFENISQFEKESKYLNYVLDTKVENKIVVTPAVKLYYENIHPELYTFRLIGEYNLKDIDNPEKIRAISLYSLLRK